MKKTIALFFALTYLVTATQLSELFKIPILAEHFVVHQDENPNISFLDFLRIHYLKGDIFDNDSDKDTKLPFKSYSYCNCNITFLEPLNNYELPSVHLLTFLQKSSNFGYHFSLSTNFLISIWQPPKFIF